MASLDADQPASSTSPETTLGGGAASGPRVPDEVDDSGPATSRSRMTPSTPPTESGPMGDTLLSAPPPADKWETELEDRLAAARKRLEDLESRVKALEARARPDGAPVRLPSGLWWVVFLVLLALIFQAAAWLRGH